MKTSIREFIEDTRGAGFVEYIILVGLVALLCIAGYEYFGKAVDKKVRDQADKVTNIGAPATP